MKNRFEIRMLGEACDVIAGQSPPSSTYNIEGRGLPFFQGKADFGTLYPTTRVWCDEPRKVAQPNDILISVRAPVGPTNLCHIEACIGRGLSAIRAKNGTDFKYVLYYLRAIEPHLSIQGGGSTFSAITQSEIRNLKIPLPPLPIQKQIAAILEKADAAREKRRQANQLTEQFLQSAFLEMFGDPVTNPKRWEVKSFGDCIDSIRYATGSPPPYVDKGIPFIRATNVKGGTIVKNELRYISPEDAATIPKCELKTGDLILVRSGVNAGDCAVIPPEFDGAYAAYDLIIELPIASAVFYNHLINSTFGKAILEPLKRRAGQPHLNADQIKSLELPAPPPSEQQKFAALVEKVESLRAKQRESEKELEKLFGSLMQRTFRGELVG